MRGETVTAPKLPIDDVLHAGPPASPLVEAVLDLSRARIRAALAASGQSWEEFVFAGSDELVTTADFAAVEAAILASGHRFDWSASISVSERPEAYKAAEGSAELAAGFAHPDAPTGDFDEAGRALRGVGDNVVRHAADVIGTALYVRSNGRVMELLSGGVPPGSIAINLKDQGKQACFSGDIMHHPIQVYHPDWSSQFCWDQAMSAVSRRKLLEDCVESNALLCPAHFPGANAGYVKPEGNSFRIEWDR